MMAFWRSPPSPSVYRQSRAGQGSRRGELESEEFVRVTPALAAAAAAGNIIFQENNCGATGNKQQVGRPDGRREGREGGGGRGGSLLSLHLKMLKYLNVHWRLPTSVSFLSRRRLHLNL